MARGAKARITMMKSLRNVLLKNKITFFFPNVLMNLSIVFYGRDNSLLDDIPTISA